MDEICHHRVIMCLSKKGLNPMEIYSHMVVTLWDSVPISPTVKRLAVEFRREGRALKIIQSLNVLQLSSSRKKH